MIIAGEASGDLHGACLADKLKRMLPDIELAGIGSRRMREAGVEIVYDSSTWSAIGVAEALKVVPRLALALLRLRAYLKAHPPDVLVLIDFGTFNVQVGKRLRPPGTKVLYYFPPSSWYRGATYERLIGIPDRVVTPFPWSAEALRERGFRADFFGHPLLDVAKPHLSREDFCRQYGFDAERPIIGLLPGSRKQELIYNLPPMLAAAAMLLESMPDLQFAIPSAQSVSADAFAKELDRVPWLDVKLLSGMAYDVLAHSRAVMVASGTATVEAAILGCPMVIIYRGGFLTTLDFKLRRKRIKFIGMPNIVLDRAAVPELTAEDASPRRIAELMSKLIPDSPERAQMSSDLAEVRNVLGSPGAVEKTARVILDMLGADYCKRNRHAKGTED
jgi:lipid-A-disaccharide synthase